MLFPATVRSALATNNVLWGPFARRTISVAIVGSGPSGCYTAKYLQSSMAKQPSSSAEETTIDVLEQLPTPYGLVRYGVAPDHPEVKNVQRDFDSLFASGGVRFFGNVQVGQDVSIQELRQLYDVVVLSYGCQGDKKSNLPGEDTLEGVLSAREFVAWYNGHPHFGHIGERVTRALSSCQTNSNSDNQSKAIHDASVVVIGHGNVALDCARILAKARPGLFETDLAARALPVLQDGVRRISIVGRRGHIQGAFTIKEVRELVKLEREGHQTSFVVRQDELDLGTTEASMEELNGPRGRPKVRIDKLLRKAQTSDAFVSQPKRIDLRFLLNPVRFEADPEDPTRLGSVVCERTRLDGPPGQQTAVGTNEFESIPAQLALVSIGYRGIALPGTEPWFDESVGVIKNERGRVDARTSEMGGLYAAGWVKRGPSGIIGTNIPDAKDTVTTILSDVESDGSPKRTDQDQLAALLKERGVRVVDWDGYRRLEALEMERTRHENQPREKVVTLEKQLVAALALD